jgi:hypothetical protein
MSVNESIDIGGKDAWSGFFLKKPDRARVLLATKHQLGFLFTLDQLSPCRQGYCHHDRHDAHRHEQSDHRVTMLTM